MQLIDVTFPALQNRISGVDRMFMAPEIVSGDSVITAKADTWTLGVILYLLVCGGVQENNS